MKVLIVDNYDSFTYNIVHLVKELGCVDLRVALCDEIELWEVAEYDKIILSPGPGVPSDAKMVISILEKYASTKSILGVCLGEQAIGEYFGAKLVNLQNVFHGVATQINIIADDYIFRDVPSKIDVGRYHSWIVSEEGFPFNELDITACDEDGNVMALAHKRYDVRGVQFHPESILTPYGKIIIKNWLFEKPIQ